MNKTLPEKYETTEPRVGELKIGESGWTLPWALGFGPNGHGFINSHYPVLPRQHGTADVHVAMTEDGLIVDLSHSRHTWRKEAHLSEWHDMPIAAIAS